MDFKAGIYNADGSGITGSSDLKIKVKSDVDDYFYDFDDDTFKASGWTTVAATMTEVNATVVPGEYEYSVTVTAWDDGVYTCYFQYSGTNPWTDTIEFRIYDGQESTAIIEELGTQAKADVNTEADTALTDYDLPTRAEATTDKEAIITEVNANETKINAIKAKTDNLPADPADDSDLDTQLAAIQADVDTLLSHSPGAGATEWTYTLTNSATGDPIADADVWVTSDLAGNIVIASGRTDQNGVVTFYLDDGATVYVWRQKTGWNFTNPDQEEVS